MAVRIQCKCGRHVSFETPLESWDVACPYCARPIRLRAARDDGREEAGHDVARPPPDGESPVDGIPLTLTEIAPRSVRKADDDGPHRTARPPHTRTCPTCKSAFPATTRVCVRCGINLAIGLPIPLSDDNEMDTPYAVAEQLARPVSWIIPFGALPVGTDRCGPRTPWAARALVVLAALASGAYLFSYHTNASLLPHWKEVALWTGSVDPDAATLIQMYTADRLGDQLAFEALLEYLINEDLDERARRGEDETPSYIGMRYTNFLEHYATEELVLDAHRKLGPNQRSTAAFEPHQVLTSVFVHNSVIRLLVNLLFFYIFATAVNAALGNVVTSVLFLLIAPAAGLAQVWMSVGAPIAPTYGLSGVVMGMAGACAALLPACRVHVIVWYRLFAKSRFFEMSHFMRRCSPWTMIALYIAIDLLLSWGPSRRGAWPYGLLGGLAAGLMLGFLMRRFNLVERPQHDILGRLLGPRAG